MYCKKLPKVSQVVDDWFSDQTKKGSSLLEEELDLMKKENPILAEAIHRTAKSHPAEIYQHIITASVTTYFLLKTQAELRS